MRRFIFFAVICLLLALPVATVYAAPPPDGPPGLERAIEVKERHEKTLLEVPGVAGVAVSLNGESRPAIAIFTETPEVRGLPASLEDVPVVVEVSGKFVARPKPSTPPGKLTPRDRWPRPVPIGVSTGHPGVTAGTIGARVKDASGNVYALSNNHVYANENRANIGDLVLQPGTIDGGIYPDDGIGTLFAYIPIVYGTGSSNEVDAAIALSSTSLLGNATPSRGYGAPKSTPAAAYINMPVKKFGRTTSLTKGRVYAIEFTVDVEYESGIARFEHQIVIGPGGFSAGGDSGSLIVVDAKRSASDRQPVGLLFAGSPLYTVANPIESVLSALAVSIDGE